jgi:hypothetical protein
LTGPFLLEGWEFGQLGATGDSVGVQWPGVGLVEASIAAENLANFRSNFYEVATGGFIRRPEAAGCSARWL